MLAPLYTIQISVWQQDCAVRRKRISEPDFMVYLLLEQLQNLVTDLPEKKKRRKGKENTTPTR